MSKLLSNELNLMLLKEICSGNGLSINLSYLAKRLKRHRKTIRKKVRELLFHRLIDRPIFPFLELFQEYPLLVAAYADLPDTEKTQNWIKEDRNVFASFRVRKGEYNTMLFEFHKSVWSYQRWREKLVEEGKIPSREERVPSRALYFSNRAIEKYIPYTGINLIEDCLRKRDEKFEVYDYIISKDTFNILKCLVSSEGIRINENHLANKLGVHRKTISNRILKMQQANMIYKPVCRFPAFFAPPGFLLVFSLVEVRRSREKFTQDILNDPHVSLAYRISEGRYNLLLFNAHLNIEDYLQWESVYDSKYPNCFGSVDNTYLVPKMAISIDQQKVSLGVIEDRLKDISAKGGGNSD